MGQKIIRPDKKRVVRIQSNLSPIMNIATNWWQFYGHVLIIISAKRPNLCAKIFENIQWYKIFPGFLRLPSQGGPGAAQPA